MLFWEVDTTINNVYLIYLGVPRVSKAMAMTQGILLKWTLGPVLARPGPVPISQLARPTRTETARPKVGADAELPPDRSCDCGHHLGCWLCRFSLGRGKAGLEVSRPSTIPAGPVLNAVSYSVLMTAETALLSSTGCEWTGWRPVHAEECGIRCRKRTLLRIPGLQHNKK